EGLLNCEDVARCLRRPDPPSEPQEPKRYDLAQKQGLADFLKDADIRLVRADFILKLHREGQRLPRRQEAESAYVDGRTALVTHEEVQVWADGKAPDGTQVISLSHCWESREHCDPYGYQVSKLAKALNGEEWVFIDYVSLYQFQRLSQQQNLSFRRAMQHMHVLYCHDETTTLRIESLTPEADIAEAETNQDSVIVYHHPTGLVKPVPVSELVENRTKYGERGWCALEKIKLPQLHLQQNELFEEGTRQVIEALQSNGTLAALSLAHDCIGVANVKALAEALRTNSALIELNLSHAGLSIDGIIALAEAIMQNRTLKQLSLRQLDLTGCDLGKAAVVLARALRTGQVKGTVTHPAVKFLCMLEDETFKELEEAQKLELDLFGRGLGSGRPPGQAPSNRRALPHRGDEAFRKLFAPLCRALPELKLRELDLDLGAHHRHFGDDEARDLAAGLGQQTELERLTLVLSINSLGRGAQLRVPRSAFLTSSLLVAAASHLGLGLQADPIPVSISVLYQLLGNW
ncbi:NLRC3, partial [Symbiodinium necroappetens]